MFDDVLAEVERKLDIPYPMRARVLQELDADLWLYFAALLDEGVPEDEAMRATLRALALDSDAMASLQAIHNPAISRILMRLPQPAREPAEWICSAIPLLSTVYFIFKEVPMMDFLHEGGGAMWLILLIGGAGLFLQMRRILSWFVLRDHSQRSLGRNTATPLYLAAATLVLSLGATALNFYVVLYRWTEGKLVAEQARVGFTESLSTVIVGAALATLIILIQAALQAGLRAMEVKSAA